MKVVGQVRFVLIRSGGSKSNTISHSLYQGRLRAAKAAKNKICHAILTIFLFVFFDKELS